KFLGVAAPRLQSDGRQAMGQQLGLFLSSALHHPRPFQKIQIIWIETGAGRRLSFSPHPSEKSKLFGLEQSKSYASPRGIDSMTKRPIDRKRDAGGAMEIGVPDDQSAITAIFPIGDDLYVVKERGIYEVKLADRIDPNRTNIAIPNTQQRVLNYGSDASVVGRTLLTAKELFNPTYLPKNLDLAEALRLCFETLRDLPAMLDV